MIEKILEVVKKFNLSRLLIGVVGIWMMVSIIQAVSGFTEIAKDEPLIAIFAYLTGFFFMFCIFMLLWIVDKFVLVFPKE